MQQERSQVDTWLVEFKDDRAPNSSQHFESEETAREAARCFGRTKHQRAYVYDPKRCLVCWCHNNQWHWD